MAISFFLQPPLWLALIVASLFAGSAHALRLLSRSGAIATALVGSIVFGLGGGKFLVALLVFFLSSSLLSKIGGERKERASRQDEKGSVRDAGQVWANGGAAAACVLVFYATSHNLFHIGVWSPLKLRYLLMLYLAALAAVNADTWATEIGKLSSSLPRLLANWKEVPAGTSGAVSIAGLLGALGGATIIPLAMLPLWRMNFAEAFAVAWAGFLASLADSVLGATLQAQYRNPQTGETTERASVRGERMTKIRGFAWLNNDGVNFAASLCALLFAWLLLTYGVYRFY